MSRAQRAASNSSGATGYGVLNTQLCFRTCVFWRCYRLFWALGEALPAAHQGFHCSWLKILKVGATHAALTDFSSAHTVVLAFNNGTHVLGGFCCCFLGCIVQKCGIDTATSQRISVKGRARCLQLTCYHIPERGLDTKIVESQDTARAPISGRTAAAVHTRCQH